LGKGGWMDERIAKIHFPVAGVSKIDSNNLSLKIILLLLYRFQITLLTDIYASFVFLLNKSFENSTIVSQ
jgi:hypothetical protein